MEGNQAIWNNNTKENSITFTSKGGVEENCQPWCTCNHPYEGMRTEWCARMVLKPDGKVRICVKLTRPNESVQREHHLLPLQF